MKIVLTITVAVYLMATLNEAAITKDLIVERTCENKQLKIACKKGMIKVISAFFGYDHQNYGCGHNAAKNTYCQTDKAINEMKMRCNGKSSCSVPASNSVFGDPCRGTVKYLFAGYICLS